MVKDFFAGKAKPCTCPPDFPVCVCGGKATGAVMTPKAVVPGRRGAGDEPAGRVGQAARAEEALMATASARSAWMEAWEATSTPSPAVPAQRGPGRAPDPAAARYYGREATARIPQART